MEKTITTALLILAGVVSIVFVFNSVYPMVNRSTEAMVSMSETIDNRMQSSINIVHAANSTDRKTVYIWVKNVGTSRIVSIDQSDLFFGLTTNYYEVPNVNYAGGASPSWDYELENGAEWLPGNTIKITITYSTAPNAGTYYLKLVIPNGISDEYFFSM
ncbi:MAG: hypothetical protein PHU08_03395 [Dehalococcoidales bacterium]|nr:hypothetical protein [Dehalococcoidales bacterium]